MLQRAPREIRKALKYVEQPGLSVELAMRRDLQTSQGGFPFRACLYDFI